MFSYRQKMAKKYQKNIKNTRKNQLYKICNYKKNIRKNGLYIFNQTMSCILIE